MIRLVISHRGSACSLNIKINVKNNSVISYYHFSSILYMATYVSRKTEVKFFRWMDDWGLMALSTSQAILNQGYE